MRTRCLLIAFIVLAGCTDRAVKNAVSEGLIDPDSAKFGNIVYSKGGKYACVNVNAKNRMGGYTGDSEMIVGYITGAWQAVRDTNVDDEDFCLSTINTMEQEKV